MPVEGGRWGGAGVDVDVLSKVRGVCLMTNIGGRWERRDFRDETTTDLVLFLSMFAGLQ